MAHWVKGGRPAFRLNTLQLAENSQKVVDEALEFAQQHIGKEPVLIYATSSPEEVAAVQGKLGVAESGRLVEHALAGIAQRLRDAGVRRFVVAGGETSGSIVSALDVKALTIGAQIDPGVPWTVSNGSQRYALALKSGNFGTVDFFEKALAQLDKLMDRAQ